jgi:cytochrome P450
MCVHAGDWAPDLFQNMPFLVACTNETLRLYPAAPQLARVTAGEEVLGGYQVPKGALVLPDVYNMHR